MSKLAIISTNESKYSETFIKTQIKHLPFEVLVYSSGYLPKRISYDRGVQFNDLKKSRWKRTTAEVTLEQSFVKEKVGAVLAQFGPSGVAVLDSCMRLNLPLIVHFHGFDAYRDDVMQNEGRRYQELFQYASAVIGVSRDMCDQLERLGCSKEKIEFIPYGINTRLFMPGVSEQFRFLSCGRFVAKKGPLQSIRAFARVAQHCPEASLVMIGDGELKEQAIALVEKLGLGSRVTFAGVLTPVQVAELMRTSFAYVQHSMRTEQNDSEGTPLAILEAAASGLPIISTRHAGIKDVVIENETGWLVNEGDEEQMSELMCSLIDTPKKAREMGRAGRTRIEEHYSFERYIAELTELIQTYSGVKKL